MKKRKAIIKYNKIAILFFFCEFLIIINWLSVAKVEALKAERSSKLICFNDLCRGRYIPLLFEQRKRVILFFDLFVYNSMFGSSNHRLNLSSIKTPDTSIQIKKSVHKV